MTTGPASESFSREPRASALARGSRLNGCEGGNAARWVWSQHWQDLLFLHWQTPLAVLQPLAPAGVEIETHEGNAWVSLVLFRLRVRPRWLPFVPGLSTLVEVNLRTYVCRQGNPGIYFLSIGADNHWAIALARCLTPLPYVRLPMNYHRSEAGFRFEGQALPGPEGRLSLAFQPADEERETQDGTLSAWLLERYRLYVAGKRGLLQTVVEHPRWVFRDIMMSWSNRLGCWCGLELFRPPDATHYSEGVRARFGKFHRVAEDWAARTLSPVRVS